MPASQAGRRRFESGRPLSSTRPGPLSPRGRRPGGCRPRRRSPARDIMRSIAVVALLAATAIGSLTAQGSAYVPPKPPCNIQPGFFRINSAVVDLQTAVEKPNQRDHMLSLAVEVLTRT